MKFIIRFLGPFVLGALVTTGVFYFWQTMPKSSSLVTPLSAIVPRPLEKYTIDNLTKREFSGSDIILDEPIATASTYISYRFHFESDGKKVTGLANIPNTQKKLPVIVQFRGFVPADKYSTGEGTRHSGEVYADNGFVTLAPDFLGYGGSDMPSNDPFEERFETYTTALNMLASVKTLPMADPSKVAIWGHSNGGHIALTVLEILHKPMPAVLWAPVSKPFPYSILFYTDDSDDHGKGLRRVLSKFEDLYDVEKYSLTNYLDRVKGPLQISQGSADEPVPQKWTDDLVKTLKGNNVDVTYNVYPGADHNMTGSWNQVVEKDIEFFKKQLTQ